MMINLLLWSPLLVVPLQIFLCLQSRRKIWKFLPFVLSLCGMVGCFGMSFTVDGWEGASYWMISTFCAVPMMACGVGALLAICIKQYRRPQFKR